MNMTPKKMSRVLQEVALIINDKTISMEEIAKNLGVNSRTIKRDIDILKELDILDRNGSRKAGEWMINIEQIEKNTGASIM